MKAKIHINSGFIVVLVIVLIILFVISLGKINSDDVNVPQEFKDDKHQAKIRLNRLRVQIEKKSKLKIELDKKFQWMFLSVRFGLIVLWGSLMYGLYFLGLITSLEDFLNYSELSLVIIFTLNFLTFGNLTNLTSYVNLIKIRTQNWVYGRYMNISDDIKKLVEDHDSMSVQIIKEELIVEGKPTGLEKG